MKAKLSISFLLFLIISSCTSQEDITTSTASALAKANSTPSIIKARTIEENNTYIDVDMAALDKTTSEYIRNYGMSKHNITEELYPEEEQMARAALHRYWSKVVMKDGAWYCTAKSAKELNMSERTFKYMDDNLQHLRKSTLEAIASGETVHCQPITTDYLNSLIK